jgi:arylsulfatase A-like enzyme
VDAAIGSLSAWTEEVTFIVTADHGGGGVRPHEHDAAHPLNDSIPLVLAGPGVARRRQLTRPVSLLDLPATMLWWFGVDVPRCYEGRPLIEAFQCADAVAV